MGESTNADIREKHAWNKQKTELILQNWLVDRDSRGQYATHARSKPTQIYEAKNAIILNNIICFIPVENNCQMSTSFFWIYQNSILQ